MTRLRRSDTSAPGLRRLPHGGGFRYCVPDGSRPAPADLDRIRALVIPPAWTDVWICPHANGHLQATGVDAAGRRQYLYHPDWRAKRDREKHDHVLTVACAVTVHLLTRGARATLDSMVAPSGLPLKSQRISHLAAG
jgi:DNA topoisomerase IB